MNFLNNKNILFSIEELFHLVPCPAATGLFTHDIHIAVI
jgi:hypothetical protein